MGKTYGVYVNGLKGKTNTIDIGESEDDFKRMTVLNLKKKVVEKLLTEFGNTDDLRLVFSNRELEDKNTLADYGIQDKSTILALLGLEGGEMNSK